MRKSGIGTRLDNRAWHSSFPGVRVAAADGAAGRGYPLNTMYAGSGLPDTAVWMRLPCIKFFQF
ncbi:hypothetical protein LAWASA_3176 [Lawsonibacter asaccharolyticus]|nr:hypothetical protein LAWASA_3176 [Lawsonibacter asaccharolyticus]